MSVISLEDVSRYLKDVAERAIASNKLDTSNPLFNENMQCIGRFLRSKREPRTIRNYGVALIKHVLPYAMELGKRLYELDEKDLAILYERLEKNRVFVMKASCACINYHRMLNGMPRIDQRRVRLLNPNVTFTEKQKFYVDLTPEEVYAIERNVSTIELALAVELMAYSGLRPSEALGLRWGDISFKKKDEMLFAVARIKHRPGDYGAKGVKGERTVPLSPRAVRLLKHLMAECDISVADDPTVAEKRIIPYSYEMLKVEFKAAVKRAAIRPRDYPITPHKLRHYFAIHYLNIGGSPTELKQIMGIDIRTLQTYIEISGKAAEDAYFTKFYKEALKSKPS